MASNLAIDVEDDMLILFQHEHLHGLIEGWNFLVRFFESTNGIDAAKIRQAGNFAVAIGCTLERWAKQQRQMRFNREDEHSNRSLTHETSTRRYRPKHEHLDIIRTRGSVIKANLTIKDEGDFFLILVLFDKDLPLSMPSAPSLIAASKEHNVFSGNAAEACSRIRV